jgi:hypothetical protein
VSEPWRRQLETNQHGSALCDAGDTTQSVITSLCQNTSKDVGQQVSAEATACQTPVHLLSIVIQFTFKARKCVAIWR